MVATRLAVHTILTPLPLTPDQRRGLRAPAIDELTEVLAERIGLIELPLHDVVFRLTHPHHGRQDLEIDRILFEHRGHAETPVVEPVAFLLERPTDETTEEPADAAGD